MAFFRKKSDPLDEELRRLEEERRELEREVSELEYELQNPPEPPPEPAKEPDPGNRGAKFPHDPLFEQKNATRNWGSLRIQRTKTRNRVILLGIILMLIALGIYRCS
jgi:hypothetical protein